MRGGVRGAGLALCILIAAADAAAGPELRLGLVLDEPDPRAEQALRGARLAVEDANRRAVPGEPRVVLEVARAAGRWSAGTEAGRDLLYQRDCLGIVAAGSGEVAHVAAQVAAKARAPLLTLAPDRALTRIPLPGLLRVVPDHDARLGALLDALAPELRAEPIPAWVPPGRAGGEIVAAMERVGRARGVDLRPLRWPEEVGRERGAAVSASRALLVALAPPDLEEALARLHAAPPECLLLLEPAAGEGAERALFGLPRVLAPRIFDPGDARPCVQRFVRAFAERHGSAPGEAAALAFDAVDLLIRASAGGVPERPAVAARLAALRPPCSLTGIERFDDSGDRVGALRVVELGGH